MPASGGNSVSVPLFGPVIQVESSRRLKNVPEDARNPSKTQSFLRSFLHHCHTRCFLSNSVKGHFDMTAHIFQQTFDKTQTDNNSIQVNSVMSQAACLFHFWVHADLLLALPGPCQPSPGTTGHGKFTPLPLPNHFHLHAKCPDHHVSQKLNPKTCSSSSPNSTCPKALLAFTSFLSSLPRVPSFPSSLP